MASTTSVTPASFRACMRMYMHSIIRISDLQAPTMRLSKTACTAQVQSVRMRRSGVSSSLNHSQCIRATYVCSTCLDLVYDHGFVGEVHDGLRHGKRQRPQSRAIAANQNQSLHAMHSCCPRNRSDRLQKPPSRWPANHSQESQQSVRKTPDRFVKGAAVHGKTKDGIETFLVQMNRLSQVQLAPG